MLLSEIAKQTGARLDGADVRVTHVATLALADSGALSWIGDARYAAKLADSKAAAFLAPPDVSIPAGRSALRAADVDAALIQVLSLFAPPAPIVPAGVHPSAIVSPGAQVDGASIGAHVFVGDGARVGPGTQLHAGVYVGAQSVIGRDCVLWPNVVVRERVTLGDRVVIHPNATIGADGFGYLFRDGAHRKIPQIGDVVIEDDVEIGANSTIDRARTGTTRIGAGSKIDNLVQIAHNTVLGRHCVIVAQCGVSGSCTLGDYVVLGGQAGVADHIRIGTGAQIAGKGAILADVPPGAIFAGAPAMDAGVFWRQTALIRRLPELSSQLRELAKRVARLESTTNDSA